MAIDCLSVRYQVMVAFSAVMILVYPIGAPAILFVMLWKQRYRLYPPTLRDDGTNALEAQVLVERAQLVEDAPITEVKCWVGE